MFFYGAVKMCKEHNPRIIDKCMKNLIEFLNEKTKLNICACCCGHGKYNLSIVCKDEKGEAFDLISQTDIPRKKRFYKKDREGYYYIPEVINNGKERNAKTL